MDHFYYKIDGWSDGIVELYASLLSLNRDNPNDALRIVEVGSWLGRSAAFMCMESIRRNIKIKFDCVDTWEGDGSHLHNLIIKQHNESLYERFIDNMKPVEGHYTPIKMSSIEASKTYEDESLDFVFIDADHTYDAVKADIIAWMPKVKPSGILAGHDYEADGVYYAVNEVIGENKIRKIYHSPAKLESTICWLYFKN